MLEPLHAFLRTWTLQEVAQHHYIDDIWITVDGKVYDITEHLVNHEAWETAGRPTHCYI